ncbi:MAG: hypothetical protein Q9159_001594 [Coniocarpon cinnabarinum]
MKICFRKIKKSVREDLIWLGAYFYYKSLKKDTLDMVDSIIKETDDARLHKKIEIFTRLKTRESRYVEVAGAVVFTSVTQSLSWPSVANANWSASALLYSSVVLAIAAVVVGAQQQRVLPSFVDDAHLNFNEKSLQLFRERLMFRDRKNRSVVFALQCPLMMLSFSVLSFLAAMCSTIFGPLVVAIRWDDNAKQHPSIALHDSQTKGNKSSMLCLADETALRGIGVQPFDASTHFNFSHGDAVRACDMVASRSE